MLIWLHPWVFLVGGLPLIVRWYAPPRVVAVSAVRVPFVARLQAAGGRPDAPRSRQPSLVSQTVVWILILVALARPQWSEPPIEKTIPTRDLLLLVDLSGSMDHQDFIGSSGQPVDRLEAVKEVLDEFLQRREGDRVALVVFGSAPFLQVPLTTDLLLCRQLLSETAVGMAGPRTALGDAIGLGIQLLDKSESPEKTMIAITDGNDTASAVPTVEAARVARDRGITVHTVAIGDPTTVGEERLDEDALRQVATTAGGEYFLALDREELAGIYDRLDEIKTREVKTVSHRPLRDLYCWPLGLALVFSVASRLRRLFGMASGSTSATKPIRVGVNSRTFELETIQP